MGVADDIHSVLLGMSKLWISLDLRHKKSDELFTALIFNKYHHVKEWCNIISFLIFSFYRHQILQQNRCMGFLS
jgi:hypothetical protein